MKRQNYENLTLQIPGCHPFPLDGVHTSYLGSELIQLASQVSGQHITALYTQVKRNGEFFIYPDLTLAQQQISDDEVFVIYEPSEEKFQDHLPPTHPRSSSFARPSPSGPGAQWQDEVLPKYNDIQPVYVNNDDSLNNPVFNIDKNKGADMAPIEEYQSTQINQYSTNNQFHRVYLSEIYHIISICCCLISIFVWFTEIIPAVLGFFLFAEISKKKNVVTYVLCVADIVVTVIVLLLFAALIIAITIFTFGLGAILFVFLIPYVVVLFWCLSSLGVDLCAQATVAK